MVNHIMLAALSVIILARPCFAENIRYLNTEEVVETSLLLPVKINKEEYRLEALFVRQPGVEKLPVALITHGSEDTHAEDRSLNFDQGALRVWAHAFARRGYLAVVILRRGYGHSDGEIPGNDGTCDSPKFTSYLEGQADDLEAALRAISAQRPDADMSRVVLLGNSSGGAGVTALSSRESLKEFAVIAAVINISGGVRNRDEFILHQKCPHVASELEDNFIRFGKTAHMPALWAYAKNDRYFPPGFVNRIVNGFRKFGARPRVVIFPPIKTGHSLSSTVDGLKYLLPKLDRFLRDNNLPTWDAEDGNIAINKQNNEKDRKTVRSFLKEKMPEKVLIVNDNEAFMSDTYYSLKEAESNSLDACHKARNGECRIIIRNFHYVPSGAHQ